MSGREDDRERREGERERGRETEDGETERRRDGETERRRDGETERRDGETERRRETQRDTERQTQRDRERAWVLEYLNERNMHTFFSRIIISPEPDALVIGPTGCSSTAIFRTGHLRR